jgi:hypothetical protein
MTVVVAGSLIELKATMILPVSATRDEIDEWIAFCLGYNGSIKNSNPLMNHDLTVGSFELQELARHASP